MAGKRFNGRGLAGSAIALALAFPSAAMAATATSESVDEATQDGVTAQPEATSQEAPAEPQASEGDGDIVVTARRRDESLQDIPAAVTALGGDGLVSRGVVDLRGLGNAIPNVNFQGATTSATAAQIYVRGIGIDPPLYNIDGAVGIYMNDIFIGRPAGSLTGGALDLQRIEVLRGPQGTLYGRNSVAGAIRYITRRPDLNEFSGQIGVTIGSEERRDLRGILNVPIIDGVLALRVAAQTRDSEGYYHLVDTNGVRTGELANATHAQDFRASLRWQASPSFTLDFIGDYSRDRSGPYVTTPVVCPAGQTFQLNNCPNTFYSTPFDAYYFFARDTNRYDGGGLAATANWEFAENLTLKSVTAWRALRDVFTTSLSGRPTPAVNIFQDQNQSQFQQELQVTSSFDGFINFVAGAFYFDETVDATSTVNTVVRNIDTQKSRSAAFFAELYLRPFEGLEVTAGARYSFDHRGIDRLLQVGAGVPSPYSAEVDTETFSPKLSISYDTGPILLYATYSEGYRPPGWATATPTNPVSQTSRFMAEKEVSYEAGVRSNLFDRRLTLNLSAFRAEYANLQATVTNALSETVVVGSDARIDGIEGEFRLNAGSGLVLFGNIGLLDTSYTRPPSGFPFAEVLKHAPEVSSQLGFTYETAIGSTPGTFFTGGEWSHTSAVFRNLANSQSARSDAFDLVSFRVGYRSPDDRWTVTVGGTNLLDETYFQITGGNFSRGYSPPRRAYASFEYNF